MPKKFKGENSKAVVAKEKKAAARHEAEERKRREEEDAYWRDDDKHVARKQERKSDKERKRIEQLEKKQEARKLLEAEEASLPSKGSGGPPKLTRAQIEAAQRQSVAAAATASLPKGVTEAPEFAENPNHLLRQRQAEGELDATTVDEAIAVLSKTPSEVDMHPEKRQKAAYAAFEDRELPRLRRENPNMRLSQVKQMLRKDWMKSPENPLNQAP